MVVCHANQVKNRGPIYLRGDACNWINIYSYKCPTEGLDRHHMTSIHGTTSAYTLYLYYIWWAKVYMYTCCVWLFEYIWLIKQQSKDVGFIMPQDTQGVICTCTHTCAILQVINIYRSRGLCMTGLPVYLVQPTFCNLITLCIIGTVYYYFGFFITALLFIIHSVYLYN